MERRPSRSFVHGSTHHQKRERVERLAATLGPFALGVGLLFWRAPEAVQVERRLAADHCVPTKGPTQVVVEMLDRGSQSAS